MCVNVNKRAELTSLKKKASEVDGHADILSYLNVFLSISVWKASSSARGGLH